MIKTCGRMFSNFAKSIENLSDQDREKYIQKFERLINYKYDFIKDILSKDRWYMSRLEHIFEKNNLDTFTDETYKQSTFEQLRMMGICYSHKYTKEEILEIKDSYQDKVLNTTYISDLITNQDSLDSVDTISGATITSKAIKNIFEEFYIFY